MAKKVSAPKKEKTIEQMLWDSANVLRGNLDAAEYKSVVLGLVFLKYINDCFMAKYHALVAETQYVCLRSLQLGTTQKYLNADW